MAAPASRMAGPKKSFASVAAMVPPSQSKQNSNKIDDRKGRPEDAMPASKPCTSPTENPAVHRLHSDLPISLSRLDLKDGIFPANDDGNPAMSGISQNVLRLDDEKSHLSVSSTKAPSFDGKSVASGTTFAMDEKESLRPDDSASLKAVEEDDSNSGPASGAASSRIGSEAGGKAFRDQFNEISERIGPGGHRSLPLSRGIASANVEPPQTRPLVPLTTTNSGAAAHIRPEVLPASVPAALYNYQEPDEKLIEAMETPKDRLFLLQLEEQVISFIKDSQEPVLDLPPCNSFCRLLAHRLGDYYALTHYVDNAVSAVRLYRTPYCRLPNPLSTYSRQVEAPEGPSSSQPSMKIMRRAGIGPDGQIYGSGANTVASSLGPSKAGSETGDEGQRVSGVTSPTDSTTTKDKALMTREEREAKYKETRERIFGGVEETPSFDSPQISDTPNEASRTSSASGKKKSKKNKHNDDDFQARSSFNAYWPSMQYSATTTYNQTTSPTAFYNTYMQQSSGQTPQPGVPQPYASPYQAVPQIQPYQMAAPQVPMASGPQTYPQNYGYTQTRNAQPYTAFNAQLAQQYYQPLSQQNPMLPQSSAIPSPSLSQTAQMSRPQSQLSDQNWAHNGFASPSTYPNLSAGGQQVPYHQQMQPQLPVPATTTHSTQTYPYGQLPFQSSPQSNRTQHPLPGSYNRQNFNPQTRAFVPGNTSFLSPQPAGIPADSSSYHPIPSYQSTSNMTQYGSQSLANLHVPFGSQSGQYAQNLISPPFSQRKSSGQTTRSQSPGQSSLSTWARPENLPPKPPPSEASTKTYSGTQGGLNMPKFQNGTYTKTA
ncbi:hypothetical protein MMC26_003215 [Xylographa opegraphella]|nr:hypothetical protein [Xylographa opegraphella]